MKQRMRDNAPRELRDQARKNAARAEQAAHDQYLADNGDQVAADYAAAKHGRELDKIARVHEAAVA